jgi:hypothetical protein
MTSPSLTVADLVALLAVEDGAMPPLLVQLRRAVWGDVQAGARGAASSKQAIPVDAAALDLWNRITLGDEQDLGIDTLYSGALGVSGLPRISAPIALHVWHSTFALEVALGRATPAQVEVATKRLAGWVAAIREHFEPRFRRPLRGVTCPNCGVEAFVVGEGDGTVTPALVANLDERDELVVRCVDPKCVFHDGSPRTGQRSVWSGAAEVIYLARQAGYDVEALAEAVRDARRPVPEIPYDPLDGVKVIVTPDDGEAYVAARAGMEN